MDMHLANFPREMGVVMVFLAVAAFIICSIFRRYRQKNGNADRRDSLEILKKRLAAGEITLDEFTAIKQVL